MVKRYRKLKPNLSDIRTSNTIYLGDCDGYDYVYKKVAPNLWKDRYYGKLITDTELQRDLYNQMLYNSNYNNSGLIWNEKHKMIAHAY